ncbi:MAG: O-methyltransferase [Bacteroidales bacterium]|jgi:predicted O-methyltransferase YrrM|nr:O-methyltransferase [Bacteroidales bacterium]
MIDLLPFLVEDYCEEHSSPELPLLYQLNRETHQKLLRPRMVSGKLQGALLSLISRWLKPENILELGTYSGYATLCLAEGLPPNGTIDTIEMDEEREEMIARYFAQTPYHDQIQLHIGAALDILPTLKKSYGLVFIDADKREYVQYYEGILPLLKQGGIILVDNVLWDGKVVAEVPLNDKDTIAIQEFNNFVQNDSRVKNVLLPFRDGLMIIEKL